MVHFKTLGLTGIFFVLCLTVSAQPLPAKIQAAANHFTKNEQLKHASTSLTVLNARTGKPVFVLNEKTGLATASCLKTITAATAFYLLGKDFTYETRLAYSGEIRGDTLFGDVVVRGGGDPTLGSWRYPQTKPEVILGQWIQAIREAGIRTIRGSIVGDATLFDTQIPPDGWTWQDMGNYYGAGSSGLTWHENQYDLFLYPGNHKGDKVKITGTEPPMEQLRFVNELKTGSSHSGDQTYIYTAPYSHLAYVRGTSPAKHPDFKVSGSVPDPALFAANNLQRALIKAGIEVLKPTTTYRLLEISGKTPPQDLQLLAVHTSPGLSEIIYWFLKRSINLYGEHLVKTFALKEGETVNTYNGVKTEVGFWKDKGLDPDALHIIDGSGLSPGNFVTTMAIARVLYQVRQESWYDDYYHCLPVIHNIRMKSGHISKVASYSGYLDAADGTPLIFSFIVNNYSGPLRTLTPQMFHLLDRIKR